MVSGIGSYKKDWDMIEYELRKILSKNSIDKIKSSFICNDIAIAKMYSSSIIKYYDKLYIDVERLFRDNRYKKIGINKVKIRICKRRDIVKLYDFAKNKYCFLKINNIVKKLHDRNVSKIGHYNRKYIIAYRNFDNVLLLLVYNCNTAFIEVFINGQEINYNTLYANNVIYYNIVEVIENYTKDGIENIVIKSLPNKLCKSFSVSEKIASIVEFLYKTKNPLLKDCSLNSLINTIKLFCLIAEKDHKNAINNIAEALNNCDDIETLLTMYKLGGKI